MSEKSKTDIDLGDDLIGTKTLARPIPQELVPPPESSGELIVNAKILISEGLYGEAKKILRKILLSDPTHVQALEKISEIQKIEIKQLLSTEEKSTRRKLQKQDPMERKLFGGDPDLTRLALEKDLGPSPHAKDQAVSEEVTEQLKQMINDQYQNARAQDHIDLGIALLEMGFYDLAIERLDKAKSDPHWERQATLLSVYAKILSQQSFEAMMELDPLIADESLDLNVRVECGYLMGRALEDLGQFAQATAWYRGVLELEAQYRDSFERLKRCEKALSSSSRLS